MKRSLLRTLGLLILFLFTYVRDTIAVGHVKVVAQSAGAVQKEWEEHEVATDDGMLELRKADDNATVQEQGFQLVQIQENAFQYLRESYERRYDYAGEPDGYTKWETRVSEVLGATPWSGRLRPTRDGKDAIRFYFKLATQEFMQDNYIVRTRNESVDTDRLGSFHQDITKFSASDLLPKHERSEGLEKVLTQELDTKRIQLLTMWVLFENYRISPLVMADIRSRWSILRIRQPDGFLGQKRPPRGQVLHYFGQVPEMGVILLDARRTPHMGIQGSRVWSDVYPWSDLSLTRRSMDQRPLLSFTLSRATLQPSHRPTEEEWQTLSVILQLLKANAYHQSPLTAGFTPEDLHGVGDVPAMLSRLRDVARSHV